MTPDGSERRKCQSKTSSEYQKDKNHDNRRNKKTLIQKTKTLKLLKIVLSLVQSSIQMETAAKESIEG